VKVCRDLHEEKHTAPSVSTWRRIVMLLRDEKEKVDDSIRFNNESDSKITSRCDLHSNSTLRRVFQHNEEQKFVSQMIYKMQMMKCPLTEIQI
jgi:hypothetical protein